jgi:long-chain acyl-CoA synthetase
MSLAAPFANIVELFHHVTAKFVGSDKPMLMYKMQGSLHKLLYREVREQVTDFAHGLSRLGLKKGSRVAILS